MSNVQAYTKPENLEKWSFLWSEARLVLAAIALFLGGVPLAYKILPSFAFVWSLLNLAWIISGIASAYLLYRWYTGGQKLFGKKDNKDTAAFFISVVSGLNLGIVGIFGTNIGMSISSGTIIFIIVGLLYLAAAWHLCQQWNKSGKKLF